MRFIKNLVVCFGFVWGSTNLIAMENQDIQGVDPCIVFDGLCDVLCEDINSLILRTNGMPGPIESGTTQKIQTLVRFFKAMPASKQFVVMIKLMRCVDISRKIIYRLVSTVGGLACAEDSELNIRRKLIICILHSDEL